MIFSPTGPLQFRFYLNIFQTVNLLFMAAKVKNYKGFNKWFAGEEKAGEHNRCRVQS